MQVMELLDSAKKVTKSDAATARALGVGSNFVSDWRHGRKTCTLQHQVKLAALAGLDPRLVIEPFVEETLQGTPWLEAARKAMGKALAGVAAITLGWGLTGDPAHGAGHRAMHDNV